jgi:hypothetical protein
MRVQHVDEERRDREGITVLRVPEAEISENLSMGLQSLLHECFPGYPSRTYFKLPRISVTSR